MDKIIKKILSSLKEERILMYKMIKADEDDDKVFFNNCQIMYKDISNNSDKLIIQLMKNNSYDEITSNIIDKLEYNEDDYDLLTLLSLVNTFFLNNESNLVNNNDCFFNYLSVYLYVVYLKLIKKIDYEKNFKDEMRYDLINSLVSCNAIRNYFSGEYSKIQKKCDIDEYFGNDKEKINLSYFKVLNEKVRISNNLEILEDNIPFIQLESKKELMKMDFVSLSLQMVDRNIKYPILLEEMSDFTKNIIEDASKMVQIYKDKEKKKILKIEEEQM